MTRDWSRFAVLGIGVNIMIVTVSFQMASGVYQFPNQVAPFHTSTPISLVCTLTIGSGVSSSIIR
jgi:uncharacterized membrane protein